MCTTRHGTRSGGVVALLATLVITPAVLGHGSMASPVSRIRNGYLEGPEQPPSAAVQAAIAVGGTQPFYDWHELVNFYPGSPPEQMNAPYASFIPDGKIASANNPKYAGLDLVRDDWPTTAMSAGPFQFIWAAPTPHEPSVFHAWITTPDWNPLVALNWAQLEALPLTPPMLMGNEYRFSANIPERTGKHCIVVIWQRIDPVGEGFYSVSDVDFGDGGPACAADLDANGLVNGADLGLLIASWGGAAGDLTGDGTTDGADLGALLSAWGPCAPDCDGDGVSDLEEILAGAEDCDHDLIPDDCELAQGGDANGDGFLDECQLDGLTWTWSVTDQWQGGFVASLTVHNGSTEPIHAWTLSFGTPGYTVQDLWNGVLQSQSGGVVTVGNAPWNGHVDPGGSASIGFTASGVPTPPTNVILNQSPVDPG